MLKKILLSLYLSILSIVLGFVIFEDNKTYAQSDKPTCDACTATPSALLQYRDLVVYILKSMTTSPKVDLKNLTGSFSNTIFRSTMQYIGDQSDELFEVGSEILRKDIVTDGGLDFIQNLFTSFRSDVYIRDLAKIKILDDMINSKATQIITDGRWDDDISDKDLSSIISYINSSKVFSDVDIRYNTNKDIIKFLYTLNTNIKTRISMGTMSRQIGTNHIIATFDQAWIDSLEGGYSCVRGVFACSTEGSSFASNLNGVGKKVTSDWKTFTRRISSSAKKFKSIKFKGYFDDVKLVKIHTNITNPFDNNKKDIQDANVIKKQIRDNVLGSHASIKKQIPDCLSDDILGANLNQQDANRLRSICQNMMGGAYNIIQSSEKADIYSAISDPRTITKLFASLSQKVDQARGDNKGGLAGVIGETTEMCVSVCSNLNDGINCSS